MSFQKFFFSIFRLTCWDISLNDVEEYQSFHHNEALNTTPSSFPSEHRIRTSTLYESVIRDLHVVQLDVRIEADREVRRFDSPCQIDNLFDVSDWNISTPSLEEN